MKSPKNLLILSSFHRNRRRRLLRSIVLPFGFGTVITMVTKRATVTRGLLSREEARIKINDGAREAATGS